MPTHLPPPIIVLGITGRSGTNYLRDLLVLHPDVVGTRRPIWEDFFLAESDGLVTFADAVRRHWRGWDDDGIGSALLPAIGNGLLEFLTPEGEQRRVVAKTPSVTNLERVFDLFPQAHVLIVVRDARAVAHSAAASFDSDVELWARKWAKAARVIVDFDETHRDDPRYRIVRYEDLVTDLEEHLSPILAFLDLDASIYDMSAAASLPVRGSSSLRETGDVHWNQVERDDTFDPLQRWAQWPANRIERFDWIAGTELEALGYRRGAADLRHGTPYHRLQDGVMMARATGQAIRKRLS